MRNRRHGWRKRPPQGAENEEKMKFLMAIIDALVGFVQRNPLTVLIIVVLALAAPALLKGIALFVLWFIVGLAVLAVMGMLVIRWRIRSVRRQMEERFGEGYASGAGSPFTGRRQNREGEVKVYRTSGTPDKRVSSDVGDYVEFEETEEKQE